MVKYFELALIRLKQFTNIAIYLPLITSLQKNVIFHVVKKKSYFFILRLHLICLWDIVAPSVRKDKSLTMERKMVRKCR